MTILTQTESPSNTRLWGGAPVLTLDSETYAEIHLAQGVVTIHQGKRTGELSDWGGACVASLQLDQAIAIAQAVLKAQQPSEESLLDADIDAIRLAADCHPTQEDEDAWIENQAAWFDERREAMYDLESAKW